MENSQLLSRRPTRGGDGKIRWVYEMSLYKNPTVFLLVWKIFFFILVGIFAVTMIADAIEWSDFFPDRFLNDLKFLAWFLLGMTVVVGLGYLLYAVIMGGKYIVEFEMDERGVLHRQTAAQAQKARTLGQAAMIGGIGTRTPGAFSAGMSAQRTEMYSEFAKVRRVKAHPRRNLIKVNELLGHNQVYVPAEDFAFVYEFIVAHCPNLKK